MDQTSTSRNLSQFGWPSCIQQDRRLRETLHAITLLVLANSFIGMGYGQLVAQQKKPSAVPPKVLTAAEKKRVIAWVKDLGDRRYVTRQQAQTRLLALGWPAIPYLEQAHQDANPERRTRARQLSQGIRHRRSYREFQELGRQTDKSMDLDQAMIAIARVIDPLVDDNDLRRQLDKLAAEVRKQLGPNTPPAKVTPARAVAIIQEVIFKQHGFTGATTNYDHPDNSSLAHVLKKLAKNCFDR